MNAVCLGLEVFVLGARLCLGEPQPVSNAASFCEVADPISWEAADTRLTKVQIDLHNAKVKVCPGFPNHKEFARKQRP